MNGHLATPHGTTVAPRRLSPRVLAIHPLRSLRAFAIPLVGVLIVGQFSFGSLLTAAVGAFVAVLIPLARWLTFSYSVRDERLQIQQGVVARSTRTIPLDRVRGVDIRAPLLHRLFGLAVVHVEAAAGGEAKEEGTLDAVTAAEAEGLRVLLLRRRETGGDAAPEIDRPVQPVYARLRPRWYLYAPLSAPYLLAPIALFGSIAGFAFEVASQVDGVDEEQARRIIEGLVGAPHIVVPVAIMLLLAVPALSVLAFAVINWNFTLRGRDGSLVTERGLFTRRSVSLERQRIRGWELVEGLLERMAGVGRLRAVITGLAGEATRAQLLPLAPRSRALSIAGRAVAPFQAALVAHPPAARTRRLVRACVPWLAAAVVAWLLQLWPLVIAFVALAALGVPLGLDRYRSLGHASDGLRVAVRSGSLRRQQAVIERRAIVGWTVKQTWFQRRVGLVTLVVGVGAGRGGYPAIDLADEQAVEFARQVTPWVRHLLVR